MKVSDLIVRLIAEADIDTVFGVTGGASIHILNSISRSDDVVLVPMHHEQAAGMAADGYARCRSVKGTPRAGCAVATSGPGATNLVTAIAGAFYDSIPVLFLTGQVATYRQKKLHAIRQFGFQETPIIDIVSEICKGAFAVTSSHEVEEVIRYAINLMFSGRKGPVVVDIPDNIQREQIARAPAPRFQLEPWSGVQLPPHRPLGEQVFELAARLRASARPVFIIGAGAREDSAADVLMRFALMERIPILTTWGAKDLVPASCDLLIGTFGSHGTRAGNFTAQNADLIVAVGTRLSTRETGYPASWFGREAALIIVDIDAAEIAKFELEGRPITQGIVASAADVARGLINFMRDDVHSIRLKLPWLAMVAGWKDEWGVVTCADSNASDPSTHMAVEPPTHDWCDPYRIMRMLPCLCEDNTVFVLDTGCTVAWAMQAMQIRPGQAVLHDFNNTAMGWALPASLGAWYADPTRRIVALIGDGSMMMNLQELGTIRQSGAPITIVVLSNDGYAMVRQTEDQWLESHRAGTSSESGLGFPDWSTMAESFGIPYLHCRTDSEFAEAITIAGYPGLVLIEVAIDPQVGVLPQAIFGYPLEDMSPHLPREVLRRNMLVPLLPVSEHHEEKNCK